ncbi:MAG: hypothetical protein WDW38_008543 [Sanguina aurantia]
MNILPHQRVGLSGVRNDNAARLQAPTSTLTQPLLRRESVITHMGRNDGASGASRSSRNRKRPEGRRWYDEQPRPAADDSLAPVGTTSPRAYSDSQSRPRGMPPPQQQFSSVGGGLRRSPGMDRRPDDTADEGLGWWEKPEEANLQAYAVQPMEDWQVERLEEAYAVGRRKVSLQQQQQNEAMQARADAVTEKMTIARSAAMSRLGDGGNAAAGRWGDVPFPSASETGGSSPSFSPAAAASTPGAGFVPFYECDTLDPDTGPFPCRVCRGLWELHRLTKEAVADWFTARRAEDGLTSSTQKRPQTGARSDRDVLEDAFEGPKTRNNRQLDGSIASDSQARATAGGGKQLIGSYGSSRDMSGLGGGGGGSGSGEGGRGGGKGGVEEELLDGLTSFAGKQAAKTAVAMKTVTLSTREMAQLRSSLPSPRKFKGQKNLEAQGIVTAPDSNTFTIGGVKYVCDPEIQTGKWFNAWRHRSSQKTASVKLFQPSA